MEEIFQFLADNYKKGANSNGTGSQIHQMIKERTGCEDPYKNEKKLANEIALSFMDQVKEILNEDNSLEAYVKIAIVGNIIDFGALTLDGDIEGLISSGLKKDLTINHVDKLEKALKNHKKLLYLVDNTGEIVFDKLLLEKLKEYDVDITIAVKEKPILNDACIEDGISVGLDKYGKLTTIGTDTVGLVYDKASPEFRELFDNSDFIISKGLGNYEGLTELDLSNKDVFFCLCSKCSATSKNIGVNIQDIVLFKADSE